LKAIGLKDLAYICVQGLFCLLGKKILLPKLVEKIKKLYVLLALADSYFVTSFDYGCQKGLMTFLPLFKFFKSLIGS
jgi:hypothetical protein